MSYVTHFACLCDKYKKQQNICVFPVADKMSETSGFASMGLSMSGWPQVGFIDIEAFITFEGI